MQAGSHLSVLISQFLDIFRLAYHRARARARTQRSARLEAPPPESSY